MKMSVCSLLQPVLAVVLAVGWTTDTLGDPGEEAFNASCVACHTIGEGKRIGPDLEGVLQRRSEDWLVSFIRSSQSMANGGDADAIALIAEYNGMVMPDAAVPVERIRDILRYIEARSGTAAVTAAASEAGMSSDSGDASAQKMSDSPGQRSAPAEQAELAATGRALFQGTTPFSANGAACNSCHHVAVQGVTGGGSLAVDLSNVVSRLGTAGVEALLAGVPFPAMRDAYGNKPLTATEIAALSAFLTDANTAAAPPDNHRGKLLASGALGSAALFGFCSLVWRGRRKGSVYQSIFERQSGAE